jgi:hypothetical protein
MSSEETVEINDTHYDESKSELLNRPTSPEGIYVSKLPDDAKDVSQLILSFVNPMRFDASDKSKLVRNFNGINTFYSPSLHLFYLKRRDDVYKILFWKKQINKGPRKGGKGEKRYEYLYVLIPYLKQNPIKILETTWNKRMSDLKGSK